MKDIDDKKNNILLSLSQHSFKQLTIYQLLSYKNQLITNLTKCLMNYKKSISLLVISLLLSPFIIYVVLFAAKLTGSTYEMSHGETFIIWLLMAIVIKLSISNKA